MKKRLYAAFILVFCLSLCFAFAAKADTATVNVDSEQKFREALAGSCTTIALTSDITFTADVSIDRAVSIQLNGHSISGSNNAKLTLPYIAYGDAYAVYIYGGSSAGSGVKMPVENYGDLRGDAAYYDKVTNYKVIAAGSVFYGEFIAESGSSCLSTVSLRLDASDYVWTVPAGYKYDSAGVILTEVIAGQKISESDLPNPIRSGWKLTGYNMSDGTTPFDFSQPLTSNTTLILQWKPLEGTQLYGLTFDKNSEKATGSMTPQKFMQGETLYLPENAYIHSDGLSFIGWNTKADGTGKAYKNNDTFTYDGSVTTLYAQWSLDTTTDNIYAVYYHKNDGTDTKIQKGPFSHKASPYQLESPSALGDNFAAPDGMTFIAWSLSKDGSTQRLQPGEKITFSSTETNIYAIWGYSVTFDPNGGSGKTTEKLVQSGKLVTPPADPTRDNCTFIGWYEEGSDTAFDFSTPITKSIALYARWDGASETVPDTSGVVILQHPQNVSVYEGEQAVFTVKAIGEDLNYQWYVDRNDGKGFVPCENSNSPSYTVTGTLDKNGTRYCCRVFNRYESLSSRSAELTVLRNANNPSLPQTGGSDSGPYLFVALCCAGIALVFLHSRKRKS